jgi:NTE family protein
MSRALTTRPPAALTAKPRIGLVLGGGGARGLAHILMLEVLDELQLKPAIIAGTSIGAIFGASYASGLTAREIRAHTETVLSQRFDLVRQVFASRAAPLTRMLGLLQLKTALINPEVLLDLLMPSRLARDFADLEIPMRVVAADLYTQREVVLTEGPLQRAVAASMALPVLFSPVAIGEALLMDGGLCNPLPFDAITDAADVTIAIDVSGARREPDDRTPPSAFEALVASSQILQHSIVREKLKSRRPDIYIDVAVDRFHVLEFNKLDEILAAAAPAREALRTQLTALIGDEPPRALAAPSLPPAGEEGAQ